ncbi:hypothetical protein Trydic_g19702 [Trypoxylus dichotomus]
MPVREPLTRLEGGNNLRNDNNNNRRLRTDFPNANKWPRGAQLADVLTFFFPLLFFGCSSVSMGVQQPLLQRNGSIDPGSVLLPSPLAKVQNNLLRLQRPTDPT